MRSLPTSSRRRALMIWIVALAVALMTVVLIHPPIALAADPAASTPPQPAASQYGGEGPCAVPVQLNEPSTDVSVQTNLAHPNEEVWIIRPNGPGVPRTGERCDDNHRPVVLLIHGFPMGEILYTPNQPSSYGNTIRNLVSKGNIVIVAQYNWTAVLQYVEGHAWTDLEAIATTVTDGFVQAVNYAAESPTGRMDVNHIGIWGHSLGGGVTPLVMNKIWARKPLWGAASRWMLMNSPADIFYRCDGIPHRFAAPPDYDFSTCAKMPPVPGNTRALFIIQQGEDANLRLMTRRMMIDMVAMPLPANRVWGVTIPHDCSHTPASSRCVNAPGEPAPNQVCPRTTGPAGDCMAGHLLPTTVSDRLPYERLIYSTPVRAENHLNYYGLYRNQQALADCARSGSSPGCTTSRTYMGTWNDGVPATPATAFP